MKKLLSLVFGISLLSLASVTMAEQPSVDLGPADFKAESTVVELTATVISIDQNTRTVTLEGPQGNLVTTKVDDDVQNLNKVKKGDKVDIQFYESVAWVLKKADAKVKPVRETTQTVLTAQQDKKPMKVETNQVRLVASVQQINKKDETVTLKGPEGDAMTIKVKDPKNLEGVKKGDQVEITYTESVAFAVKKK